MDGNGDARDWSWAISPDRRDQNLTVVGKDVKHKCQRSDELHPRSPTDGFPNIERITGNCGFEGVGSASNGSAIRGVVSKPG
jgi:hypothetical protein